MDYLIEGQNLTTLFDDLFNTINDINIAIVYSEYEKKIETNLGKNDIINKILKIDNEFTLQLALYKKSMKGNLITEKIDLDPEYCDGKKYRYRLLGWGLIIINISLISNKYQFNCNSNSQNRAWKWYNKYPQLLNPDDWDWKEIKNIKKHINRILKNNI